MPENLYIWVNCGCAAILLVLVAAKYLPDFKPVAVLFSRRFRVARVILLAAIVAVSGAEFFRASVYEPMFQRSDKKPKSLDFAGYWLAALDLRQGHNIYRDMAEYIRYKQAAYPMANYAKPETESTEGFERLERLSAENHIPVFPHFTYPPTWYLLFVPLTHWDWRDVHDVWLVANLVFVFASILLLFSALRYKPGSPEEFLAVLALVMGFSPLIFALKECQANSLILFLVSLSVFLVSRKKERAAGLALALGAVLKVFPLVLLLLFAWKRRWRLALWGLISLCALVALSIAAAGWQVHYWYLFKVVPAWASNLRPFDMNQSIAGVVARALVGGEGIEPIAHLPVLARALVFISQLGLAALALWATRGRARQIDELLWLQVALVIVFYQLASTWVLIHHLQWLLVPFALVWVLASKHRREFGPGLLTAFAGSYALVGLKYIYYRPAFRGGVLAFLASLKCFGTLLLFGSLVWAIERFRAEARDASVSE